MTPLVHLSDLPSAPDYVSGLMNFRSIPVPVIDFSQLSTGFPCNRNQSTRIVIVEPTISGRRRLLGLMVERATDTVSLSESKMGDQPLSLEDAPYLGQVTTESGDLVQLINIEGFLTDKIRHLLKSDHVA